MNLVGLSTKEIHSLDHEVGHWQSSLASVRKLSDTLIVEEVPFNLSLPFRCPRRPR